MAKPQRRAVTPLRGEVRPQKRFCPLQTCSPYSKPSQPPLGAWRAGRVHPHLFSVWQLGDALSFPRYSPSIRRWRAACLGTQSILPCSVRTCRGFTATGRGQTAKAFLPASNVLSSLKTVTATPRGLACGSSSSSFILGLAVGGRIVFPLLQSVLSPPAGRVDSGSTAFEFFPLQREVQDADDENHHVSGPGGRLVCHHRPEGCVFSHPGRSKTQEIPSVRLWREGLPIQGPALRPGFGSEDIYQMHGCCTGPFEAPGHSCTELSG